MEALLFLLPPLVAALGMVLLLGYLGTHVIERGVIFVDLAIAQCAALGVAVGLAAGIDEHSSLLYPLSLAFALAAAGLFAGTRSVEHRVPQEALIGLVYAVASAASLLVLSQTAVGLDHVKGMLVGTLLWSGWDDVAVEAGLYTLVGVVLWRLHPRLTRMSTDPQGARAEGQRVLVWDLVFYSLFAVVITHAVQLAGVLLVFSFLVAPAAIGRLLALHPRQRQLLGWSVSTAVTVAGLAISFVLDLPAGATIVVGFGAVLLLAMPFARN